MTFIWQTCPPEIDEWRCFRSTGGPYCRLVRLRENQMPTDRKTFVQDTEKLFDGCLEVMRGKQHDYAQDSNAFHNFERDAKAINLTKYQTWAVHYNKQSGAILQAVARRPHNPDCESEPIAERIKDAINYLALLYGMIMEHQEDDATPYIPLHNLHTGKIPIKTIPVSGLEAGAEDANTSTTTTTGGDDTQAHGRDVPYGTGA